MLVRDEWIRFLAYQAGWHRRIFVLSQLFGLGQDFFCPTAADLLPQLIGLKSPGYTKHTGTFQTAI